MLTVRPDQLRFFEDIKKRAFAESLFERIALKYPAEREHLSEAGLRSLLDRGIAAASKLGLEKQGHIAQFTELLVEYGESFQRSPQSVFIHRILEHPTLPGQAKLHAIRNLLAEASGGRTLRVFR